MKRLPYRQYVFTLEDGSLKTVYGHVLVLEAFIGPRPEGFDASHINGIHYDNRLENLTWESRYDNCLRRIEHGTHPSGENHNQAKLTDEVVLKMKKEYGDTSIRNVVRKRLGMPTFKTIAIQYGITQGYATNIINGKTAR